ncbi:MAG: fibronectin type III domain-containing protein [Lachnospiraceae bacterium]
MKCYCSKKGLTLLSLLMMILLVTAGAGKPVQAAAAKSDAPAVSAETVGPNIIKVSWTGVKNADGYRIYIKDGTKWVKQGDYKSTTRWVRVWGLEPGTEYTFTVRAYTKTDSGTVWGSYDKTGASAVTALSEPELSGVTWTGNGLKVSWKAVNGADGYRIYRKNSPSDKWKLVAQVTGQKQSTYTDKTAAKTDSCSYTVKAFRYDGKKKISSTCSQKGITYSYDAASEKPAEVTKPAAPAVSAETISRTTIKVSWKGVTGADGYRIYIKNGNKWVKQGDYKSTTRWVKVGGLNPNTKYTVTVRAYTKTDSGNVWGDYDKTGASAVTAR